MFWTALGEVQLLVLPSLLLGGCAAKAARFARAGTIDAALGPTALFPLRLRRSTNIAICLIELGLGIGLIATAGRLGAGDPAKLIRIGTSLLFVVATAALIELRSARPGTGCGCFGELSTAPVDGRSVARSALLATAALETTRLPALSLPRTGGEVALILTVFLAELAVLAAISPEVKEALVRLGYSEPCETRPVPPAETLAALRRSAEWRRHSSLLASEEPTDVWRELCWRYLAFAGAYPGRETELVFAIYLENRRPAVHSVLVDSASGAVIDWPAPQAAPSWLRRIASLPGRAGVPTPVPAPVRMIAAGSAAERAGSSWPGSGWLMPRFPLPNIPLSSAELREP